MHEADREKDKQNNSMSSSTTTKSEINYPKSPTATHRHILVAVGEASIGYGMEGVSICHVASGNLLWEPFRRGYITSCRSFYAFALATGNARSVLLTPTTRTSLLFTRRMHPFSRAGCRCFVQTCGARRAICDWHRWRGSTCTRFRTC